CDGSDDTGAELELHGRDGDVDERTAGATGAAAGRNHERGGEHERAGTVQRDGEHADGEQQHGGREGRGGDTGAGGGGPSAITTRTCCWCCTNRCRTTRRSR